MENVLGILGIIAVIAALIALAYWKKKVKPAQDAIERGQEIVNRLPIDLPTDFVVKGLRTPMGVLVESVAEVPLSALIAIDAGISNLLNATLPKFPVWTQLRAHSDFCIWFIEPSAENSDKSPALIVKLKRRDGSVMMEVQSAGTSIGTIGNPYPVLAIVLPHQAKSNWEYLDYLMRSTWNEGEHLRENQQPEIYMQYVNGTDEHPHHPLPAGVEEVPANPTAPRGIIGNKSAVKSIPHCAYEYVK